MRNTLLVIILALFVSAPLNAGKPKVRFGGNFDPRTPLRIVVTPAEITTKLKKVAPRTISALFETELMNKYGLKKQVVNPNVEIQTNDLNCIPVTIQCDGQLSQIFEFFKSLQRLDRIVRIEQITLVNDKNFNGQISMQTKAFIYYKTPAGQG